MFAQMSSEQWSAAHLPKITGSCNLHTVLSDKVDFFIMMSSAVAISGNAGQSNYAGACAYQDALAHHRRRLGLPAYSINVGAVVDSGFVSENPQVAAALRRKGFGTITTSELLALLNYVVSNTLIGGLEGSQSVIGILPKGNEPGLRPGAWLAASKFRHLSRRDRLAKDFGESGDVAESIALTKSAEAATDLICQAIIKQLSKLLATPVKYLSSDRSLDDYGIDSLVAVELRNWIGAFLQANIPILVLRRTSSIQELAVLVAKDSRLVSSRSD